MDVLLLDGPGWEGMLLVLLLRGSTARTTAAASLTARAIRAA